jgi:rare lipoprotein A
MGRKFTGGGLRVARVVAPVLGCLVLMHCSSSKYSDRVVAEGEPIPKGGGTYRVGKPYSVNGRIYIPGENPSYRAEGVASWYGPDFHGRLTANGEVYDMHAISAAHPTMPLPSYARVTNLDNGRSIIVRVNDRGPYVRNRIIDLSIGTAKALDFYGYGLARVRVEYVGHAPLEGSDDTMLLATLREGAPAPAPSKVMIASAKPFLPKPNDGNDLPLPADRKLVLNSTKPDQPGTPQAASPNRLKTATRSASADPQLSLPKVETPPLPRTDAPALGLMSGRGLY